MVSVEKAYNLILDNEISLATEFVAFENALGRVLAEDLFADRDFPPFDRVTMDGIAIDYQSFLNGNRKFNIQETQAAGEIQTTLQTIENCIEIMTGGVLPFNSDTVIRYEDLEISGDSVVVKDIEIKLGQNIHRRGQDKLAGELVLQKGKKLNASHLALAAALGKKTIEVLKMPRVAVISSGDELVEINQNPLLHQIRKSNIYAVGAILKKVGIQAEYFHIADNLELTIQKIGELLQSHPILIFSGGVSMGKKDFIPEALKSSFVEKVFHKISQKPGKPMWFGRTSKNLVFALPGNPVSTYLCTLRYILPFFEKCLGLEISSFQKVVLAEEITFKPMLSYFLQVKTQNQEGVLMAYPLLHNGSGDFISLAEADGFIELSNTENTIFKKGQIVNFLAI